MKKEKKYISLSFDDASADYYNICYPYFVKNRIPSTLFVISGVANGDYNERFHTMTLQQIIDVSTSPIVEIASHGHYHNHKQKYIDVENSINLIKYWTKETEVGYATPFETNPTKEILNNKKKMMYIRIGERFKKHPICFYYRYKYNKTHDIKWLIKTHSKFGNRKRDIKNKVLYSIQVRSTFSANDIYEIIKKCKNRTLIILQFHTITNDETGVDVSNDRFPAGICSLNVLDELIKLINSSKNLKLTTIKEGTKLL